MNRLDHYHNTIRKFAQGRQAQAFDKDDVLLEQKATQQPVGLILKGVVGKYIMGHEQRQASFSSQLELVGVFGEFQWINWSSYFEELQGQVYKALTDVEIVFFDEDSINCLPNEVLLSALCQESSDHLVMLLRQFSSKTNLKFRLLMALRHIRKNTAEESLPLTLNDFAALTRSDPSNMNTLIKELEEEGLVKRGYRSYWIADEAAIYTAAVRMRQGPSPQD